VENGYNKRLAHYVFKAAERRGIILHAHMQLIWSRASMALKYSSTVCGIVKIYALVVHHGRTTGCSERENVLGIGGSLRSCRNGHTGCFYTRHDVRPGSPVVFHQTINLNIAMRNHWIKDADKKATWDALSVYLSLDSSSRLTPPCEEMSRKTLVSLGPARPSSHTLIEKC
jgi:hypothetical protein